MSIFSAVGSTCEEKQYSVGEFPRRLSRDEREGRPTEKATRPPRLIDRPLRPLFPKGMRNDVQVVATVLSHETRSIRPRSARDDWFLRGAVRQQHPVEQHHRHGGCRSAV